MFWGATLFSSAMQIRYKVLVFDVVHTAKEHGGFKTRHLYPPRDFYNRVSQLCGAVVIGSSRVGGTDEIDLHALHKEAEVVWDVHDKQNRKNGDDSASDSGDGRSSSSSSSSGDSDSVSSGSNSDGSSGGSGNNSSNSGNSGGHSRRKRGGQQTGEREAGDGGRMADKCFPRSAGGGGGGGGDLGHVRAQYEKTKGCAPVYDRAIYEENTSLFGRILRDALSGECIEAGHHDRVLVVDLYNFLRREFRPFERPRGDWTPTEPVVKATGKDAAKEKERQAKLGPKAIAEEARREKEVAQKRKQEEEKRRTTQARQPLNFVGEWFLDLPAVG